MLAHAIAAGAAAVYVLVGLRATRRLLRAPARPALLSWTPARLPAAAHSPPSRKQAAAAPALHHQWQHRLPSVTTLWSGLRAKVLSAVNAKARPAS